MNLDAPTLHSVVREAINSGRRQEIQAYEPVRTLSPSEYCMFLKPELTTLEGAASERALAIINETMSAFSQEMVSAAVLPGRYLKHHAIMERHYSVINVASVQGLDVVDSVGRETLKSLLATEQLTPDSVYGGHQFIDEFQYGFSQEALSILHDSLHASGAVARVGPSVYAVRAVVDGEPVAILNGFHPFQLAWFNRTNSAILVLAVRTQTPWKELRQGMTGSTIPARAASDTIRGKLLSAREEIGVGISPLKNGVHVSAGPVEAAVEIARYMSDFDLDKTVADYETSFGHQATSLLGVSQFQALAKNPIVRKGEERSSVFEMTEELDPPEALTVLQSLEFSPAEGEV